MLTAFSRYEVGFWTRKVGTPCYFIAYSIGSLLAESGGLATLLVEGRCFGAGRVVETSDMSIF